MTEPLLLTTTQISTFDGARLLTKASAPSEDRKRALEVIAQEMVQLANACGAKRLVCTTPLPHIADLLEGTGPTEVTRGCTYFSWKGA